MAALSAANMSLRLDAEHNETCIRDTNGNKIDLDAMEAAGISLDLDLSVEADQTLTIDPSQGSVTAALDNATLATVCQFPVSSRVQVGSKIKKKYVGYATKDSFIR